jgi:nucleoid-associated protein YgaU
MRMKESLDPYESQAESYDWDFEEEVGGPRVLWGRVVALGTIGLVLFLLGYTLAPNGADPAELESLRSKLSSTQQQLSDANGQVQELQGEIAQQVAAASSAPDDSSAAATGDRSSDQSDDQQPAGTTYRVRRGDALQTIADEQYGDAGLYTCIMQANGLTSQSNIEPGDKLTVPDESEC